MRHVIGIDIRRTFGEVMIWENGLTRHEGRVEVARTAVEGFGRQLLTTDEVVIEATGNCIVVSRVLKSYVKRLVIANPFAGSPLSAPLTVLYNRCSCVNPFAL